MDWWEVGVEREDWKRSSQPYAYLKARWTCDAATYSAASRAIGSRPWGQPAWSRTAARSRRERPEREPRASYCRAGSVDDSDVVLSQRRMRLCHHSQAFGKRHAPPRDPRAPAGGLIALCIVSSACFIRSACELLSRRCPRDRGSQRAPSRADSRHVHSSKSGSHTPGNNRIGTVVSAP